MILLLSILLLLAGCASRPCPERATLDAMRQAVREHRVDEARRQMLEREGEREFREWNHRFDGPERRIAEIQ